MKTGLVVYRDKTVNWEYGIRYFYSRNVRRLQNTINKNWCTFPPVLELHYFEDKLVLHGSESQPKLRPLVSGTSAMLHCFLLSCFVTL